MTSCNLSTSMSQNSDNNYNNRAFRHLLRENLSTIFDSLCIYFNSKNLGKGGVQMKEEELYWFYWISGLILLGYSLLYTFSCFLYSLTSFSSCSANASSPIESYQRISWLLEVVFLFFVLQYLTKILFSSFPSFSSFSSSTSTVSVSNLINHWKRSFLFWLTLYCSTAFLNRCFASKSYFSSIKNQEIISHVPLYQDSNAHLEVLDSFLIAIILPLFHLHLLQRTSSNSSYPYQGQEDPTTKKGQDQQFVHCFFQIPQLPTLSLVVRVIISSSVFLGLYLLKSLRFTFTSFILLVFVFTIHSFQKLQEIQMIKDYNQLQARYDLLVSIEKEKKGVSLRYLIGNMAHDLKTPLTSLFSNTGVLSKAIDSLVEKQEQNQTPVDPTLEEINSAVRSIAVTNTFLSLIVNRCIEFGKTSNGIELIPKLRTIPWRESLLHPLNCIDIIQQRIKVIVKDNISRKDERNNYLTTDEEWLQENLLCILSNAVKFAEKGPVVLSITDRLEPLTSERIIYFEVEDDGCSLSEEDTHAFFDPWKSSPRLQGGVGLGLYTLAKRIESLKGKYGLELLPNKGKVVWFGIPFPLRSLDEGDENLALKTPSHDSIYYDSLGPTRTRSATDFEGITLPLSPRLSSPSISSAKSEITIESKLKEPSTQSETSNRVLVVDDSPTVTKVLKATLMKLGKQVDIAENGKIAVEKIRDYYEQFSTPSTFNIDKYELILMDFQMPIMDGIEAGKKIREIETTYNKDHQSNERQLIIGMSAVSDEEVIANSKANGFDDFISKPFSTPQLLQLLHQWNIKTKL